MSFFFIASTNIFFYFLSFYFQFILKNNNLKLILGQNLFSTENPPKLAFLWKKICHHLPNWFFSLFILNEIYILNEWKNNFRKWMIFCVGKQPHKMYKSYLTRLILNPKQEINNFLLLFYLIAFCNIRFGIKLKFFSKYLHSNCVGTLFVCFGKL